MTRDHTDRFAGRLMIPSPCAAIHIGPANDTDDDHATVGLVDPGDHSIATASGAVSIGHAST